MATSKPRITITLNHRQYEVLKAISDCSNQPMSAFISELLEESLPVLERMAESFRKIKAAQDEQKKRIASELEQAQKGVEPILAQVLGQFDLFMGRLEAATGAANEQHDAGADRRREARHEPRGAASRSRVSGVGRVTATPVTNRGVTPTPIKTRKAPTGKASKPVEAEKVFQKSRGRKP